MTQNCVTNPGYTSGSPADGLGAGDGVLRDDHRRRLERLPRRHDAGSPVRCSRRSSSRRRPRRSLAYGTTAGSINVSPPSVERPGRPDLHRQGLHQRGHDDGCVTSAPITSGTDVGSLAYTQGQPGTELLRDRHRGRARAATCSRRPRRWPARSPTRASSARRVRPSWRRRRRPPARSPPRSPPRPGTAPASYTATVCTNAAMTTELRHRAELHVGRPAHRAHVRHQLLRPDHRASRLGRVRAGDLGRLGQPRTRRPASSTPRRGVSLAYGTVAGSIAVTYTGSSNAPGGQTYSVTACTNPGDDDGVRDERQPDLGREPHRPRLRPGHRRAPPTT